MEPHLIDHDARAEVEVVRGDVVEVLRELDKGSLVAFPLVHEEAQSVSDCIRVAGVHVAVEVQYDR